MYKVKNDNMNKKELLKRYKQRFAKKKQRVSNRRHVSKIQKGWVAYDAPNRKEYYIKKYSKIWNDVIVIMTWGIESRKNGKYGINYQALIAGYKPRKIRNVTRKKQVALMLRKKIKGD